MLPSSTFVRRLALGLSAALLAGSAVAHGPHRGYWRYDPWLAPLVVGTAVGTAVYLSRPYPPAPAPTVVVTSPPMVVVNNPFSAPYTTYSTTTVSPPMPLVEAYYCREAAQYYPVVPTCPSPWMLVRTP